MDSLRWILLALGALFILGIYFWDLFRNKKSPRRPSEVIFNQDITPDFQLNPKTEDDMDYSDAISDLGRLRASLDNSEETTVQVYENENPADEIQDDTPENEEKFGEQEQQDQSDVNDERTEAPIDDLIYLRIVSGADAEFKGLRILIATKNAEMKFGNMNIFHHYGVGDLKADKPVFSLANMYEPGEFNLQEMESFSTRGLVLYMSLPTPLEAGVSLELLLNTAQRITDELGGELRDAKNRVLDEDNIREMREKVKQFTSEII